MSTDDDAGQEDRYRQGLPDHHDPTAGIGGAPPARSALSLRLALAIFGLVAGIGFAVWAIAVDAPTLITAVPIIMAVTAAVDIIVVARRKARGEPG